MVEKSLVTSVIANLCSLNSKLASLQK
jgi:PLP dependent protein